MSNTNLKKIFILSACALLAGAARAYAGAQTADAPSPPDGQTIRARQRCAQPRDTSAAARERRMRESAGSARSGGRGRQGGEASLSESFPPQPLDTSTATAIIPVRSARVAVRPLVPEAKSGEYIKRGGELFPARTVTAQGGFVTLALTAEPVLIEDGEPAASAPPEPFLDGPFGVEAKIAMRAGRPAPDTADLAREAGMSWLRYCQPNGLVWGMVEKSRGKYDWASLDYQARQAQAARLNLQVVIYPHAEWDNPAAKSTGHGVPARLPKDMGAYLAFIRAAAERYDGNGINDAPGSPLIKCWEVGSEIDTPVKWSDTPENYALLLKKTYETIKAQNPSATVLMSGWMMQACKRLSPDYWDRALREIARLCGAGRPCYDAASVHWFYPEPENLLRYLREMRETFARNGLPPPRLWITSLATFTGAPQKGVEGFRGISRTEDLQAQDIVKLNIAALADGAEKTFWGVLRDKQENSWWSRCGIVSNGGGAAGAGKLGFYTYRLLNEKLARFAPGAIKRVEGQAEGVFLYRYIPPPGQGPALYFGWASAQAARRETFLAPRSDN